MKIWIQLQKWFHPVVYAYAVISSPGNLSTLLRNGTSEGVDFMRWGRKDGRTDGMGALLCRTKVKLSIYLLAYLSHFYSERLICPPQWDEILLKVAYLFWQHLNCVPQLKYIEKVLKGSLNLISSPSPSIKVHIMGAKICLRCKGKILFGVVYKILKTKSLLTSPSNISPYYLK